MKQFGQIDWARFRLLKLTRQKDKFKIDFEAPTIAGGPFEPWSKTCNTAYTQPHEDMLAAFIPMRGPVLRLFDWPASRAEQVQVIGLELTHDPGGDCFEVSFQFIFAPSTVAGEMEFKKTLPLSSITGLSHSLLDDEIDHVGELVEEIRLYVSRQKGANTELFGDRAVVELNKN